MSVEVRYHATLRKKFLELQMTYGITLLCTEIESEQQKVPGRPRKQNKKNLRPITVDDDYSISISVMRINSNIKPGGICPNFLVFGAMLKLPLPDSLPASVPHTQRMMIMDRAKEEYVQILGKMKLK